MSAGEIVVAAAGIAGATYLMRRRRPAPRRTSWDVPSAQKWQADRLREAGALYRAGRSADAKILLRDRAIDWNLLRTAAAAQLLDPVARRIAQTLEGDGSGMFLNELHQAAPADRDLAIDTLVNALADYTGPAGGDSR